MRRLAAFILIALLAPAALAQRGGSIAIGEASLELGQGCHDASNCHPEEYAWVAASACTASPARVLLEVERVVVDAPPILAEVPTVVTGDPACPHRASGLVEFWSALVDMPVDCLRASLVAPEGVLATRFECFSDV